MREFHGKNHRAAVSVPERASVSTPREPRSISNCTQFISTALEPDSPLVIAGLDPAIHHLNQKLFFLMDARVKPGHDGSRGSVASVGWSEPGGLVLAAPGGRPETP